MSEKTINKVPNVPNLRFPEFIYEWTTTSLELLTTNEKKSFAGGPFGSDLKTNDYTLDGVPIIQLSNITEDYLNFTERLIFTSVKKADSLIANNAYPGDLIIAKMMPAGRCCIAHDFYKRYVLGSDAIRVNLDIKKCNKLFMREQINTKNIRKIIASKTAGSTRQRIGIPELKNLKLYTPTIEEQNKIGKFLSMIDERILTQSKIISKYETLIKGLCDKVFRHNKSIRLSDLVKCRTSTLQESNIAKYRDGEYKVFGASGVIATIDKYQFKESGILVLKDGSNAGKVQFASGKYSVIGTSVVLIPNDVNDAKFLYFALLAVDFDKYKVGSGIPHIYFKDYSNEQIYYPEATLREKINKTLSCYETKVETEKEMLSALQKQKTFLLQSMFI